MKYYEKKIKNEKYKCNIINEIFSFNEKKQIIFKNDDDDVKMHAHI